MKNLITLLVIIGFFMSVHTGFVTRILHTAGTPLPPRKNKTKYPTIFEAIKAEDSQAVKDFVKKNPSLVDKKDGTGELPLVLACGKGSKEVVEFLISKGADVNAENGIGETPLHEASRQGRNKIAELLISNGADVNAKTENFGETPLILASRQGFKEVVELLISKGADVNAKDGDGWTALRWAKTQEIKELLRNHGAKN